MFGMSRRAATELRTISPREVADRLAAGAAALVDVREAFEVAAGHIPGARHLALSRFAQEAAGLPTDRPLILYCLSGARSAQAIAIARRCGVPVEGHLAGGIRAWVAAGLPIVAGSPATDGRH